MVTLFSDYVLHYEMERKFGLTSMEKSLLKFGLKSNQSNDAARLSSGIIIQNF